MSAPSSTLTTTAGPTSAERYLDAERTLWTRYGLAPAERFVELREPRARLRVLDIGFGEPVLFVHGLLGPDAFAPLVRELRDFRCLVLDRPGWGRSTRVDYASSRHGPLVARSPKKHESQPKLALVSLSHTCVASLSTRSG